MMYYVYVYLNPLKRGNFLFKKFNFEYEPFYIGIGKKNRINRHIFLAKKNERKTLKDNIILKILNENIEPIRYKLYENITLESAKRLEICLIKLIGRRDLNNGTLSNLTDGGDGLKGICWTDEMKNERSLISKKLWDDGVFNGRNINGENNGFYKKTHTKESKEKIKNTIGESRKGELNANYNHKWTLEMKEHLSELKKGTMCGENNPSKKTEVRKKISEKSLGDKNSQSCKFILISPKNEEFIIFGGIKNKLKELNLNYNSFYKKQLGHKENKGGWKLYNLGKIH